MKKRITIKLTPKAGAIFGLQAAVDHENVINTQGGAGRWSEEVTTHPTVVEVRARGAKGAAFECEVSCEIEEEPALGAGGSYAASFKL